MFWKRQDKQQNPLRGSSSLEPLLEEIRNANYKSRAAEVRIEAQRLLKPQVSSIHVAGFMDYDPKVAAKNAYKMGYKANMKRENSWFNI